MYTVISGSRATSGPGIRSAVTQMKWMLPGPKYATYQLNIGSWNPSSLPFDIWAEQYKGIRSATYFINNIDGNEEILRLNGQQRIDQYKAEARFVKALIVILHCCDNTAPIVILGNDEIAPDAATTDFQVPRSSYDESADYIAGQLDSAAAVLPLSPAEDRDYGRVTKGAALALSKGAAVCSQPRIQRQCRSFGIQEPGWKTTDR